MKEEIEEMDQMLNAALEEIDWALNPYKDQSTKEVYLRNAKRFIGTAKEISSRKNERIEQLEKALKAYQTLSELEDKLLVCYRVGKNPGSIFDKLASARKKVEALGKEV